MDFVTQIKKKHQEKYRKLKLIFTIHKGVVTQNPENKTSFSI
jgi:hypothetical protein